MQGPGRARDVVVPGVTGSGKGVESDRRHGAVVSSRDTDLPQLGWQQRQVHALECLKIDRERLQLEFVWRKRSQFRSVSLDISFNLQIPDSCFYH